MAEPTVTAVVIVAAGRGTRAGGAEPKQWHPLAGQSVLARSVAAFAGFPRIVVVLHSDDMARGVAEFGGRVTLVAGGATRSASVRNALESLAFSGVDRVLIHDGARPFVPAALIGRVTAALDHAPAAAPALGATDALWTGSGGRVTGVADRAGLFRAQTPQGFHFAAILTAHRAIRAARPTMWRSPAPPGLTLPSSRGRRKHQDHLARRLRPG